MNSNYPKVELELTLPLEHVEVAVEEMAREIRKIGSPLTFVVILKGGVYIAHEILKILSFMDHQELNLGYDEPGVVAPLDYFDKEEDIVVGYIGLSSYGESTKSQGSVRVMSPLDLSTEYVKDRNVVIVDDCIETGNTLYWAKKMLSAYEPKSVHTAVFVDKVFLREEHGAEKPDIVGYVYPGRKFLVGMGMGYKERYRELPEVYEIN
jgi:hypoxanthine phosphoribosyltransferase